MGEGRGGLSYLDDNGRTDLGKSLFISIFAVGKDGIYLRELTID